MHMLAFVYLFWNYIYKLIKNQFVYKITEKSVWISITDTNVLSQFVYFRQTANYI